MNYDMVVRVPNAHTWHMAAMSQRLGIGSFNEVSGYRMCTSSTRYNLAYGDQKFSNRCRMESHVPMAIVSVS